MQKKLKLELINSNIKTMIWKTTPAKKIGSLKTGMKISPIFPFLDDLRKFTRLTSKSVLLCAVLLFSYAFTPPNVSPPDFYTTIQDVNDCPEAPVIAEIVQPTCDVETGAVTVTTENNLEYSIDGTSYSTSGSFENLESGTYEVTAKNADGCVSDPTEVIIDPQPKTPAPPEVETLIQPTCVESTGTIILVFTYTINDEVFQSREKHNNLEPGIYHITARNSNGCESDVLEVTIDPQPETPATPVVTNTVQPTCKTSTGSFTLTAEDGISYSINGEDYQSENEFTDLEPGTYTLTSRNEDGCVSDPSQVIIEPQPETPAAPETESIVQPTCEVETGSITIVAENGNSYSINGEDYQTNPEFTELEPGTYELTAKNADECVSEATQITIDPQPDTPAAPEIEAITQPICEASSGSITIVTEEDLTYSINGEEYQTSGEFSELEPGTYEVTARNAAECVSEATQITIDPQPETPAAPEGETVQPNCEMPTGSFTVTTEEGISYSINGEDYQTTGEFPDLEPGTYHLTAKNTDGCISEVTQVIIDPQPETPAAPEVESISQPTCEESTGSLNVITEENTTYSINGTDYQSRQEFTGLAPGTYNLTARNEDGCISPATEVTIQDQPATPASPVVSEVVQPTCEVETGSISIDVEAGMGYSINGTDYVDHGEFNNLPAGTYQITAKNEAGCISSATEITLNEPVITPEVENVTQPDCEVSGSINMVEEEGVSFSINGGDYQTGGEFIDLEPGIYRITSRNEEGCVSEVIEVTINEYSPAEIETTTADLCTEDSPFNLSELLVGDYDETGTWEDPQQTGSLQNETIDPGMLEVGQYTFNYVVMDGTCASTTPVTVTINDDCVVLPCGIDDIKANISKTVTPNGDNINDYFEVGLMAECGFTYKLKIFNRWGNLVYKSDNYQNDWDGISNQGGSSKQLPSGTYYYILEINQSGFDPIQGYIYLGTKQ